MIEDSLIPNIGNFTNGKVQQDQLVRSALRFANKIERKSKKGFHRLNKDCISVIGTGTGSSVVASGKSLAFDGTEFVISGSGGPGIGTYDLINGKAQIEQYNYMPDLANKKLHNCTICFKQTQNKKYCSKECMYESLRKGDHWKGKIREKRINGLKRVHKQRKGKWYINITKEELGKKLSLVAHKNWSKESYRRNREESLNKTMKILRKDPNYQQAVKNGLKKAWSKPKIREHYFNGMKTAKKETEIEMLMKKEINRRNLPLKYKAGIGHFCIPDHVSYKYKMAIFDDGDYWHANPSRNYKIFTKAQLHNIENDKKVNKFLEERGWSILRFWESDIKKDVTKCVDKIQKVLLLLQETLLVHPLQKAHIEKLPHFTSLMHYGEPILQEGLIAVPGKFGDILGLDAYCSINCPTGSAYVLSRGRTTNILGQYSPMGMFVEIFESEQSKEDRIKLISEKEEVPDPKLHRRPITTGIKALEERDSVGVYITARYSPVVLRGEIIDYKNNDAKPFAQSLE